ncbi:MAG: GAF domain-containing protein [Nostocaceae cyanobacterium]|nr:GAF domain-containing protein [Nostocaceae cyanobacterium]
MTKPMSEQPSSDEDTLVFSREHPVIELSSGLKSQATALAVSLSMLPVLAVGTAIYYFGNQSLSQQMQSARRVGVTSLETTITQQQHRLAGLLVGTGVTALLAGTIAAVWANRTVKSTMSATTAAIAANTRLTEQTINQRRLGCQKVNHSILTAALNQDDILKTTVQETRQAFAADRVMVTSSNSVGVETVVAEAVASKFPRAIMTPITNLDSGALTVEKTQPEGSEIIDNIYAVELNPDYLEQLSSWGVKASLSVPIFIAGKRFGRLVAHQCSQPRTWQPFEVDLFSQLAVQVGFVLNNAKLLADYNNLHTEADTVTERLNCFTDAIEKIYAQQSRENVLNCAVEVTRSLIQAQRVLVLAIADDGTATVVAESLRGNWSKALRVTITDPCLSSKYLLRDEKAGVKAINDIYEAGLSPCYVQQLERFAVKANLVAPILQGGKIFGLLVAHQCSAPRIWRSFEVQWFTQLAMQVGFALDKVALIADNTLLHNEANQEIHWQEFFADTTQKIHTALTWNEVLNQSVTEVRRVLCCDRVLVYSVDCSSQGVVIAESVDAFFPKALGRVINDPCFEARYIKMYEDGRVRALNNIYEAGMTPCYIEQLEKLAVKANLVAPVLHEGKLLGLLVAHQCSEPRNWQRTEISWFKQIATQVGFALDNVKLLERVNQMTQTSGESAQEQTIGSLQMRLVEWLRDKETSANNLAQEVQRQKMMLDLAAEQIQTVAESSRELAATTQQVERHVRSGGEKLQAGQVTMTQTMDAIAQIHQAITTVAVGMEHLTQTAQQISQSLYSTNTLVMQVNQQVMNVAISTGRSQQVSQETVMSIAETVRSLTQQFAEMSKNIDSLLAEVCSQANNMAAAMTSTTQQVVTGTQLAQQTQDRLVELTTVSHKLSALVESMVHSLAAQVQTTSIASQTTIDVADVANQTSEQSSAIAESITRLAEIL